VVSCNGQFLEYRRLHPLARIPRLRMYEKVETSWNVMAHAQKPDFLFQWKGRVHLNRQGASVQSTDSRGVRISCSNAVYTMFRGSVKSTAYPLHSTVSPSLSLPCVTVCHHISTGVYKESQGDEANVYSVWRLGSVSSLVTLKCQVGAGRILRHRHWCTETFNMMV